MDSTAASETFGIEGTPLDRVVDEMVTGLRAAAPAAAR